MSNDAIYAVIGAVATLLAALVPLIIVIVNKISHRDDELLKFVYIKAYHLTSKTEGSPVYNKHISRLNTKIDVFDEFHLFRFSIFRSRQERLTFSDRSSGTVDMDIIHPWQPLLFTDKDAERVENNLVQTVKQPSKIFFSRSIYFNSFQREKEYWSVKMERDTQEARLLVDFSSIPAFETFLKGSPEGLYIGSDQHEEPIGVAMPQKGVYWLTKTNLKMGDVMRINFIIDWSVIEKQEAAVSNPP